ncbi:phospholipase D family protein [Pseudomonas mosselii]|uniref:phospholipase D family protein n=1 Tax=Pseudomonas mosselii TaxID=78327 RepID=UPI0021DB248D|nr:phospholipase D family protein [Pseudomonas mosselii]MCU9529379.1 phospholipase D family protein [Pseudomonas mosselii]MCU9536670.1 phospholipase D family protein [Pseudomonas mosselii]MCU9542291.1 phospholipase D family protein [Pseudomonas mosselii]MCU9548395.1 phospholipase D family protein [Pseudomonas mosselii]
MIRIRTKMAPRWKMQIQEATTPLTVLSPYITKNSTLKMLAQKQATFYTRFEVRDFVCGASTLAAFKHLLANKCKIYEIKDLHAKVIMDEEDFVTLGSQNLTYRGSTENKELSVCFDDGHPKSCERVRSVVKDWTDDPDLQPIDWARVFRMDKDVRAAKEAYEEFNQVISKLQDAADLYQAGRIQAAKERQERDRVARKAQNLAALRNAVQTATPSGVTHTGVVRPSRKSPCLKFYPTTNLLEWTRKNGTALPTMEMSSRCLCVLDQQKVGWARLASQQITKFAQSMTIGGILPKPFDQVRVTLSAAPKDLKRASSDATMVAILKNDHGAELCSVSILYSIDDISVLGVSGPKRKSTGIKPKPIDQLRSDLRAWIEGNTPELESRLSRNITSTTPLPKKLDGLNADKFLGGMGSVIEVTMVFKGRNGTKPILVAKTIS